MRLAAVNDAAARLGLTPGIALADTRAMYPGIAVMDDDPEADRRLLEAVADWCDRYTPLVGLDPPDGLVLDITGCAHLFGGEAALCRDLLRRLAEQGLHARAAAADTVGCASAVARYGNAAEDDDLVHGHAPAFPSPLWGGDRSGVKRTQLESHDPHPHPLPTRGRGAHRVRGSIVPSQQTHDVLLPLPLVALRIAPEIVADLAQVGLRRIADVIARPRAPRAARFGEHFVRRIDQALGREDESITPRLPVPSAVAEQRFPEPIAREEDVLGTIEHLARELKGLLERRGEGARLLQVALFRADGKVHRMEIGTAAPVRDPERVRRLFAERLAALGDACDPGFGFDMVRLAVLVSERSDPVQTGLVAPDHGAELAHLIDRLGARFGLRRVTRLVAQDSHIPEFAVAAMPAHAVLHKNGSLELRRAAPPGPLPLKGGGSRPSVLQQQCPSAHQDSRAPIRPIRLFERPERIETTAEVPDGPPVQFTWRRVRHLVAHVEGPERIAMEWWRDEEGHRLTRDYFRVESKEGIRVWLYREGSYCCEPKQPQWYIHGLFA
ncbi:MAG: protein ImuB [Alphaproteobacteria bacterium]|nr:protein ImuB [Alphaproteobacteria bacterium]